MNVKQLRNDLKRSQKSSVSQSQRVLEEEGEHSNEDDEMIDLSYDKVVLTQQPQRTTSDDRGSGEQPQISKVNIQNKRQVIQLPTVVLDGFTDKAEKQHITEKLINLGMVMGAGLPSKLNNTTANGLTVVVSKNGTYEPPQNLKSTVFVVNK